MLISMLSKLLIKISSANRQLIVLMKDFKDIFNITGDAYRDEFMAGLLRLAELPTFGCEGYAEGLSVDAVHT